MPNAVGPIATQASIATSIQSPKDAARAFEALMLKQLMGAMTKTVEESGLFGGGFENDMYSDMFASAVAEQAAGAGVGMSSMIMQALGVDDRVTKQLGTINRVVRADQAYRRVGVTGTAEPPENSYLNGVARDWLGMGDAPQWGKEGSLTRRDLGVDLATEGHGGIAHFNVADTDGYKGYPKCNLFAFEMLRRAGYSVPLRARERGWGYPGAEATTRLSSKGETANWARVRTADSKDALDQITTKGVPLLLTSSAPGDRMGHMAVADRVHSVTRNTNGDIAAIEYSGWEAGSARASYGRRVWRTEGVSGNGRGGLDRIEVLEPMPAASVGAYQPLSSGLPGASLYDK